MLPAMGPQMYYTGHHRHVLRKMDENVFQSACATFHVFFVQNAHCFHNIIELEHCTACRHFTQIYLPIENIFLITTGNSQNIIKIPFYNKWTLQTSNFYS